jgi:hypothetical protein
MTIRCSIASKENPRAFLKKGIASMFATRANTANATPPVDTAPDRETPAGDRDDQRPEQTAA